MLIIDLLRHGALQGGVKYRGALDEDLTQTGREAMDKVWQQLQGEVDTIICSPLSRCAEPALLWAEQADIPCVVEPAIQELSYGDWEGLTAAQIEHAYPGILQAWRQDPTPMTPPNGEPMLDFSKRIQVFLHHLIQEHKHGHVLLVAHSGSIRMLIAHALQAPIVSTRHLSMPYACWSRLKVDKGHVSLQFHAKTM
ncbi:histidine phosphatase family protein [Ghiorsea bivora]|uniref:histidine phosphatase family protein n=1 Tax=Ghiorsea bivora TaxID=1485545 RepID=UPI00056FCA6C|nr:histidine phosphatase family protein [Ghiorsea bivora]